MKIILASLLWWWGPAPTPTLQLVVAPVGHGCVDETACTPAEVEQTRARRAPQTIPNTMVSRPTDPDDVTGMHDGYRRQLGVPDVLPVGWVMWWGELP